MASIPEDAAVFISLLTDDPDDHTPCVFCALYDGEGDYPPLTLHGTLAECWQELEAHNKRGYGVFVAINEVSGLPRRNENVIATRAVFADFDTKHEQHPPPRWPLPPSMVVRSGGGWHAYWLGQVPLERWNELQSRVAARLGSDRQGTKGLPRIMRLPGTLHCKSEPTLVRLDSWDGVSYSADQLNAAFPDERLTNATLELAKGWKPGHGHDACLALAGALARAGWEVTAARSFVDAVCVAAGMAGANNSEVEDTFAKHSEGARVTGWSTLESIIGRKHVLAARAAMGELGLRRDKPVVWAGADEGRVARELLAALVAQKETYTRGGSLVYVAREESGALRIYRYTRASLRSRITDAVTCIRPSAQNDDAPVPISPPDPVVAALVETPTLWEGVPALEGIADYPVMAPSGKVLGGQGYDEETKLWIDATVPEAIDVDDAIDVLLEPFVDFPLTDQGRSAVLAMILTIQARPAINGACPAFVVDSNAPRVGKKKVVDAACLIATGRPASVSVQPYDDDEFRKRVLAILESGAPVALVDDCKRSIGGGVVDPLLTAWPTYSDRRLGVSELVHVPANCVWTMTGTNVEIRDHTANRVVMIRLETELEDPARREGFVHPRLEQYVSENAETFRAAGLALLQGWVRAGRPRSPAPPLGSYEQWGMVRDVLHWAGQPDPVVKLAPRSVEIDGAALLYAHLRGLGEKDGIGVRGGHRGLRVPALIRAASGVGFAALGADSESNALDEALSLLLVGERTPRRLGATLRGLKGRIIDGYALNCAKARDNTSVWYVHRAGVAIAAN